jgi:hypothetical protein
MTTDDAIRLPLSQQFAAIPADWPPPPALRSSSPFGSMFRGYAPDGPPPHGLLAVVQPL